MKTSKEGTIALATLSNLLIASLFGYFLSILMEGSFGGYSGLMFFSFVFLLLQIQIFVVFSEYDE